MKNAFTLQIASGIALAIMAGAGLTHHAAVDKMIAFAGMTRANGLPSTSTGPALLVSNHGDSRSMLDELTRQNESLARTLADNKVALSSSQAVSMPISTANLGEGADMQRLLSEVVTQNRYLRDQISETNRDLMTLQFQVDSHSTQFRPLNLAEESSPLSEIDTSIGLLPPHDLP